MDDVSTFEWMRRVCHKACILLASVYGHNGAGYGEKFAVETTYSHETERTVGYRKNSFSTEQVDAHKHGPIPTSA